MRRPRLSIRGRTFVALLGPLLKRALLASATASRQRYAPLMCNTRARSRRLLTGIDIEQPFSSVKFSKHIHRRMMWMARMRL